MFFIYIFIIITCKASIFECLNDILGLCVRAPHFTGPKQSHVRRSAKSPLSFLLSPSDNLRANCQLMEPLPALVSSLWTNKGTTQTHTQACGFTHTFSNLLLEKAEKNERKRRRNETRIMCVLTETVTIFESNETLSLHAHKVFYLKFIFLFCPVYPFGFWQSRGREEEVEIDGSREGYAANCRMIG